MLRSISLKRMARAGLVLCFPAMICLFLSLAGPPRSGNDPRVITRAGSYPSRNGKYVVDVWTLPDHFVHYRIRHKDSKDKLNEGVAGNAYMKFFLCWDESNNLWIDSEDTGRVVLCRDGAFIAHEMSANNFEPASGFPQPPQEFVDSK